MKIAILGGGFTGLAAAYHLSRKGHDVTILEKAPVLGGLAVGFKNENWAWYLERAYHHLFSNDRDILKLAEDVGFDKIFFKSLETDSLYSIGNNYRIIPLDSPQDLLRFPSLSLIDKIRAGIVLGFLKLSPFLKSYEKKTAQEFIQKYMGARVWNILWKDLFRKKFGKYEGNILTSFFWARIKKRTPNLGYIEGGFQTLIDHLEIKLSQMGVKIKKDMAIHKVQQKGERFLLNSDLYDAVVSTLPSIVLSKVTADIFPDKYLTRFKKLKSLHAVVLIIESQDKFLDKTYWLNICTDKVPVMGIMQHTNLVDKKHYGGNNILYVANYVDSNDPLFTMSDQEIFEYYLKQLKKINPKFKVEGSKFYVFRGPFAQPIFDRDFLKNKPDFKTPVKNFYIANLDMTYPYDRGTNYAVKLGREVSELIG